MGMKTALVTGGSRGIGAAVAKRLEQDGYRVAIIARNVAASGSGLFPVSCDLTDRSAVEDAMDRILQELGAPAILVNNAGFGGPFHRVDEVSDEEWENLFALNVRAPFWLCRALLPRMKAAGFGRVINIGSVQSLRGASLSSTYVATKHALLGYTQALACEWGAWGITCNIVCPGYVRTEMLQPGWEDTSGNRARIPAGRFAEPEEIAEAVSFLASPRSSYMNGAVLTVDGGLIAGYR